MRVFAHILLFAANILVSLSIVSCGTKAIEKWAGKIYSYQVNDLAFERKQDNDIIPHDSFRANGMFCMTKEDFLSFLDTYVVNPKLSSPKDGQ